MKIYNEVVIDMNPESSSYGETLHEDSFEYKGPMMLAIKTGSGGGMDILGRDLKQEIGTAGRQASRLASAKKGGAGLGGLLGAVVGVALAPFTAGTSLAFLAAAPAVAAAIGGGLGALAGSKIGGATSGVSQDDLLGGKFLKQSRVGIAEDIAKSEFTDVAMAAASGYMQAGTIGKGIEGFKAGGLQGLGSAVIPGFKEASVEAAAEGAITGTGSILDVVKGASIPGPGEALGGVAKVGGKMGGIGKVLGGMGSKVADLYGGADKLLGGVLPDIGGAGQPIGEGWISGLLGSQTGQEEYSSEGMEIGQSYEMSDPNLPMEDFLSQHATNMLEDSSTNSEMQNRIKEYMSKGWAPDNTIDMNLWNQISGIMGGR